ncbi:hypothetical protein C1645_817495 [Glomus cerebriforme]|uniref:Uncharacterized protein n=1 Tax=Glomus cerebriforme TaxID=658196 RepID=A0A397TE89_9GLOM|nr:hypothetical protein C1645_817495 [Glomus cerebriforme]
MYPIQVGMKTQVEINGKKFIMCILEGNKFDLNQPGYVYQCDSNSSEIKDNSTNAITSLYRQIFQTQIKILGLIVMDFDKESIYTKLLHDIEFCLYSISIADKLSIMIFGLENQFEVFFSDKANKRFSEIYPNGMKRIAFMTWIENGPYRYHEDLKGLYSICAEYGYENELLQNVELIKHHMKKEYVCEISVKSNGHINHNECINHYLPYAFDEYNETHSIRCSQCSKLYSFFDKLDLILPAEKKQLLNDKKEKLLHYLTHQM